MNLRAITDKFLQDIITSFNNALGIAETKANEAETSATNAGESASDAQKQAQETVQFTDSNGVIFDKGSKGYAQDASASATEASTIVNVTNRAVKDPIDSDDAFGLQQTDEAFRKVSFAILSADVLLFGQLILPETNQYIKNVFANGGDVSNINFVNSYYE